MAQKRKSFTRPYSRYQLVWGHLTALMGRVHFQGHACGCWQDSVPHRLLSREAQFLRDAPHLHVKWTSPQDSSPSENWLRKSEQIRGHESTRKTVVTDLCNLISESTSLFFCPVLLAISMGLHKHMNRQQGSLGVVAEAAYYRTSRHTLIQVFIQRNGDTGK